MEAFLFSGYTGFQETTKMEVTVRLMWQGQIERDEN